MAKVNEALGMIETKGFIALLEATDAMLKAALDIVSFFREHAPRVAGADGSEYPVELERLMSDRLDELALASR